MRRHLRLNRERLSELSASDLSGVVGAARPALSGNWTCDLQTLLTPIIVSGGGPDTTTECVG